MRSQRSPRPRNEPQSATGCDDAVPAPGASPPGGDLHEAAESSLQRACSNTIQIAELLLHPGPLARAVSAELCRTSGGIARIRQQPLPDSRRHTVERPWITPARPALQPLRAGEDVPETEPSDPEQLGETSDHHKMCDQPEAESTTGARHPAPAAGRPHRRSPGRSAAAAVRARPTPQLTRGVMRIADPEHGRIRW